MHDVVMKRFDSLKFMKFICGPTKKPNQVLRFALLVLEASTKNDLYYSEAIYTK